MTLDDRINGYVTKYMEILSVLGQRPIVKLRSHLGSKWLGRSSWAPSRPDSTVLELQQSIVGDERTLERVIAHEMIHHRDALALSKGDIALLRVGIRPDAHGASFREGAARVNAVMGQDFVTAVSDKEYTRTPLQKKFVVLITPLPNGQLGWTWAARVGPKGKDWVAELVARGSRLVHTSDDRWARGRKIKSYGGYSIPRDSGDAALLKEMYEGAA